MTIGFSILTFLGFAVLLQGQTPTSAPIPKADPATSALEGVPGWQRSGPLVVDMPPDLDRVESANASTLRAYGFDRRTFQEWSGPNGSVKALIYRMKDSMASYGLFSVKRDPEASGYSHAPFGVEGFRVGDKTVYWTGSYVVELQGSAQAVGEWAKLAEPRLTGSSVKPAVVEQLPSENRVADTERYLAGTAGLDRRWGVEPSQLGFEQSAEGALATYRVNGNVAQLLLLMYPTPQIAMQYEKVFAAAPAEKGRVTKRAGTLLAVAASATDETAARTVLDSVIHEYQVTKNEAPPENPGLFLYHLIRGVLIVVGIAVVAGVVLGGIRIFFKWKYPNRFFDRAREFEVIQLHLSKGLKSRLGETSKRG